MGIKTTPSTSKKTGKEYLNIDLRDIPYEQSIEMSKRFKDPLKYDFDYGDGPVNKYLYNVEYEEKDVSFFVPEYWKTDVYEVMLHEVLTKADKGAILKVTKKEGRTKSGKSFRYWVVEEVGYKPPGTSIKIPNPPKKDDRVEVEIIKKVFAELGVVPVDDDLDAAIQEVLTSVPDITEESVKNYCKLVQEASA